MALHRAKQNDWDKVAPVDRNIYQHIAARTHGIVTIPNSISLLGGAMVLYGLLLLRGDSHATLIIGTMLLLIGRLLDIADGYIADWTKTKSPVGEAIDATIDKLVLVAAVFVLMEQDLLPVLFGAAMFVHAAYIAAISVLARIHQFRLHPSRYGKLSVWFEWCAIGSILLHYVISHTVFSTIFAVTGWLAFAAFIALGILAAVKYTALYYRTALAESSSKSG